jgi:mannose-6-phosphate isomerase-like protein (cupin superfamily)
VENEVLKIIDLNTAVAEPMDKGRGSKIKLVNTSLGTESLDVHLNRLVPGGARGNLHKHSQADNIYIVRSGQGELIADGKVYAIRKDQVVFIPANMPHSLSNVSDEPLEIFEIYAPAGSKFDFIAC